MMPTSDGASMVPGVGAHSLADWHHGRLTSYCSDGPTEALWTQPNRLFLL